MPKILLNFHWNSSKLNDLIFRYGGEVGDLTENALSTAGNTYLTVYNAAALGPKGLAKRVVKNTGKVLVNADPEIPELQNDSGKQSSEKSQNEIEKRWKYFRFGLNHNLPSRDVAVRPFILLCF